MKKRVLAIAMSLAMTLSLLPVSALAAETGETPEEETSTVNSIQETNSSEKAENQDQELTADVENDEDTQVTVGDSVENPVATIGETGYKTLAEAIEEAPAEATIQMQKDTTLNGAINVRKDITLDLNGKTITSDSSARWAFAVGTSGVTFTIDDTATGGTIKSARTDNSNVIVVSAGNLVVKNGTLENNWYVVYVSQSGTATIEGGTLKSKVACALSTNGSSKGDKDYSGNAVMNVKGGHLISEQDVTIYVPAGTLNVSGGTIEGYTAIYVKSGTTSITGGTIKGTGEKTEYQYVGGGCAPTGDAVVIDACGYPNGDPAIEISGGSFKSESENASAVADYQHDNNKAKKILVTGGTFDSDVSKYIPSGMKQEGGEVVIDNEKAVASVNGVGYDDLQEAIENAGNSDTVKLLKETTSEAPITISEGQRFTLDLGGYTLTVSGTQAVQDEQAFGEDKATQTAIVNNGTLTIANGTIITTADCNSITNTGTLEITQDTVLSNRYETYSGRNLIVNLGGTVMTAGQLTSTANNGICTYGGNIAVTGGTISATHYQDWSNCASGITIFNRSYDNNSTGATVTISGGTIEAAVYAASTNNVYSGGKSPSNLTITGGTLTATKSTAIYWPSAGTLTIGTEGSVGGPTINSERGSAVEICSGTLNVYGGTLNGGTKMTEEDSYPTDQGLVDGYRSNSGSAGTGDAVTVISRRGSGYDTASLTVNISGGTFNSPKNYGVRYMDCNLATGADQKTQDVQVEITGGNFDGGIAAVEAKFTKTEDKDFISGGSYSDSVSTYLTNKVDAELQRATGNTPFSYYKTIEEASANAQPGDIVKDLNAEEETACTVTIDYEYGSNSTITVAANSSITLPDPGTRAGYTFNGWRSSADNDLHKAGTSVTITADTTFTANWTRNQTDRPSGGGSSSSDSGDYLISVDRVSGGRVTVQPGRADKGDTVTITVYPNDGYELDELVVTDSRGNEIDLDARSATRFTFTMPGGKVTVEASFVREGGQTQTPQTTFADVPASAWYYNAVEYVYENGLMSGVSGGRFAPDDTLTRAMLVQTLYAMEGRPAAASAGFADVASGDWYASAVNWAAANGVVSGVSETGFGPNNALTREQLALILYRFAQYKGYDVTGTSDLAAYADGSSVSGWAAEAMGWAVDAGLISGVGGNQIAPTGTASRAQVAQILMNFCENVAR